VLSELVTVRSLSRTLHRLPSHLTAASVMLVWAAQQPGDQRQDFVEHLTRHGELAIWNTTHRPWLTTLAPILISCSRKLVSEHGSAALGIASVRMKLPRL
jgi:hypothetical protein